MKARNKVHENHENASSRHARKDVSVFFVSSVVNKQQRICRGIRNYEFHENHENALS